MEDGLKVAQETRIPVFCVGMGKVQERVLRRVAKLTSGEYVAIAETTGGSLAQRMLTVTETLAAEASPGPAAPALAAAPTDAHPAPTAALPAPASGPSRPLTLLAGFLLALAALFAVAFFFVRSRRPPRPRLRLLPPVPRPARATKRPPRRCPRPSSLA